MARLPSPLASTRGRVLTYSLGLLVLLIGYYLAVLGPLWARSQGALREVHKLERELQALGRARQELAAATEARDAARRRYEQLAARVLQPDDLPRAVGFVQQLAAVRDLQVQNVRHTLQGPPGSATSVRLDLDVQGPYGGVLALAEALESHFPALKFVGMALEGSVGQAPVDRRLSSQELPGSPGVRASLSFTVPLRQSVDGSGVPEVAWSAPQVTAAPVRRDNPFRPSLVPTRAAAAQAEAVLQGLQARVTGVVLGAQGPLAVLRLADRSHVVRPGDQVGPLKVVRVDAGGVLAELQGRRLEIPLR